MNLIQKIVIACDTRPLFKRMFHAIYTFGLKVLLHALAKQPEIAAVYGTGSFFEGNCVYGLSDIDLILVFKESCTRADMVQHEVVQTYQCIRRLFPFLGNWGEKSENLIFLSEVRDGFPVPESFRLRAKQGRLQLLAGTPFPEEFLSATLTLHDITTEITTLLRIVLSKPEQYTSALAFWQKIFRKLAELTVLCGYVTIAEAIRTHDALTFLNADTRTIVRQRSHPEILFPLFLEFFDQFFQAIRTQEEQIAIPMTRLRNEEPEIITSQAHPTMAALSGEVNAEYCTLPSMTLGMLPHLSYFGIDTPIATIEMKDASYAHFRKLLATFRTIGHPGEEFLLRLHHVLVIVKHFPTFLELVPLNPVSFANVYAHVFDRTASEFSMPVSVYHDQQTMASRIFAALSKTYSKHAGHVKKLPFPCLYMEDDLTMLRDAFARMRSFVLHTEGVDVGDSGTLIRYLCQKFTTCQDFLTDVQAYYNHMRGLGPRPDSANQLYRCLHQFMAQLLAGQKEITLDDHRKRLGLTVGIITRNRAHELAGALESLTRQIRPADEILIVDNGSTDQTRQVIEEFQHRLPISYYFLQEASIPAARNLVLERSRHEIVSFTDDDCIIEPQWLNAVERGFLRADNIGIVGGWVKHEPSPQPSDLDTYYSIFHHNKT